MRTTRQNDRTGGRLNEESQRSMMEWLRGWEWRWWVTLTFSLDRGCDGARFVVYEFLNEVEAAVKDSLSCVIAGEQKTFSGSGKPAGRVHFHLLISSTSNVSPKFLSDCWKQPKFGGHSTSGGAAHIVPYDPRRGAMRYLLKFQHDPAWDLIFRNLELISPVPSKSAATSCRMRRKLARHGK